MLPPGVGSPYVAPMDPQLLQPTAHHHQCLRRDQCRCARTASLQDPGANGEQPRG